MAFNFFAGRLKFIIAAFIIIGAITILLYATHLNFDQCSRLSLPKYVSLLPVDGKIVANWLEPENAANCNITYLLKYTENGISSNFNTTAPHYFFQSNTTLCTSVYVEIILLVGNRKLDSLHGRLDFEPHVLLPVENLDLFETKTSIMAEWSLPNGFERCNLDYEVSYAYGHNSKSRKFITRNNKISFDIDLTVCVVLQVEVVPIIQGVPGPNAIHNYTLGVCELESNPVEELVATVCDSCEYIFLQVQHE